MEGLGDYSWIREHSYLLERWAMAISRAKLILHPVRLRVLTALARRQLTARQVGELLPDVPQATLYAQLGLLRKAGLLRVVSERQVRGTVEKVYAIADESASLSQADFAAVSPEDHLHYFTLFVATLIGEFEGYLRQVRQDAPIDFIADGVGYRQTPLFLSDEEFLAAATEVNRVLFPLLGNQPSPERRRRLFTTIVFPDVEVPAEASSEAAVERTAEGE